MPPAELKNLKERLVNVQDSFSGVTARRICGHWMENLKDSDIRTVVSRTLFSLTGKMIS